MRILQYSEPFYEFVNSRSRLSQPDQQLAVDMLRKTWGSVPDDAPNFVDIEWDSSASRAVLTYTTHQRARSAQKPVFAKGGHRISTRPGRLVTQLLGGAPIDGHALDVFVQAANTYVMTQEGAKERIHVIKGDLIGKWYDSRMYCDCTGHGGLHSCMSSSGYDRLGTFDLYKDHCEMVVVLCGDCGYLQARAIIWTDRDNGNKFVDRIYGNNLNTKMLENWAAENGYYTVHGHQQVSSVPEQRIAVASYPFDMYERMPYIDTIEFCHNCRHGYFTSHDYHQCDDHHHTITRPTMEWEHDRPLGPVRSSCDDCGGPCLVWDESDPGETHGHEMMCENASYCEYCGETHCGERRCYNECEHCGESYSRWDDHCPNSRYCSTHNQYYCTGEDGEDTCLYATECDECGMEYCGTCSTCNTRCVSCGQWRPVTQAFCTNCSKQCACGAIVNRISAEQNNGRCTTCYAIIFPHFHRTEADFTRAYQEAVVASEALVEGRDARYFYNDYAYYFRRSRPFSTSNFMFEETDWARRRCLQGVATMPTIVPIPLDVRAELIEKGIAL